jgi:hypothetical protein
VRCIWSPTRRTQVLSRRSRLAREQGTAIRRDSGVAGYFRPRWQQYAKFLQGIVEPGNDRYEAAWQV